MGADRSAGTATTGATSHHHVKIAAVHTALGPVVANPTGRVMFRFLKDGHDTSACGASCRSVWPPVMSPAKPHAAAHIHGGHLGRTRTGQVTYYGHPLYYYVADPRPGKTVGDGTTQFGDRWYVVSPAGRSVKPKPKPSDPRGAAEVTTASAATARSATSLRTSSKR
jgi:predicted lipoprotein with Yx(FWY)xxD motif